MSKPIDYEKYESIASVFFPVFANYEVEVIFTPNIDSVTKRLFPGYASHLRSGSPYTHYNQKRRLSTIVLGWNTSLGLFAHEAYHATSNLLKEVEAECEENYAYHTGFITQFIYNHRQSTLDRWPKKYHRVLEQMFEKYGS